MAPQLIGTTTVSNAGTSVTLTSPGGGASDLLVLHLAWFYWGSGTVTTVPSGWTKHAELAFGHHHWVVATAPANVASLTFSKAGADGYVAVLSSWGNLVSGTTVAYKTAANRGPSPPVTAFVSYNAASAPAAGTDDLALYGFFCNGTTVTSYSGFTGTRTAIGTAHRYTTTSPLATEEYKHLVVDVSSEGGTLTTGNRTIATDNVTVGYGSGTVIVLRGLPDPPEPGCRKDTYTRTVAAGAIGTSDSGDSYDLSGAIPEVFSVGPDGVLHIDPTGEGGSGGFQVVRYERTVERDALVQYDCRALAIDTDGNLQGFYLPVRWVTPDRAYVAVVDISPTYQNLTIYQGNPWGVLFSPLVTPVAIPPAVAGQWYTFTCIAEGVSPTTITATWRLRSGALLASVTTTDSTAQLQTFGKPGLGIDFQGEAAAISAEIDNFKMGDCALLRRRFGQVI